MSAPSMRFFATRSLRLLSCPHHEAAARANARGRKNDSTKLDSAEALEICSQLLDWRRVLTQFEYPWGIWASSTDSKSLYMGMSRTTRESIG